MNRTIVIRDFDGQPLRVEPVDTSTPGLAVHGSVFREPGYAYWNVTHIASGKRIPGWFETSDQAVAFANELAPLADWTTPGGPERTESFMDSYVNALHCNDGVREAWQLKPSATAT